MPVSQHLTTTFPIHIIKDYDNCLLCIEFLRTTEIMYVKYLVHWEAAMLSANPGPPSGGGPPNAVLLIY